MVDPRALIAGAAKRARDARDELAQILFEFCPRPHLPKQHRDGNAPWCDACGYTETGIQPVSEEMRQMLRDAATARAASRPRP